MRSLLLQFPIRISIAFFSLVHEALRAYKVIRFGWIVTQLARIAQRYVPAASVFFLGSRATLDRPMVPRGVKVEASSLPNDRFGTP